MLEVFSLLTTISFLIEWHYISLIRGRLHEADKELGIQPLIISNLSRSLRRYWEIAPHQNWSRGPIFVAGVAFLTGLSCWVEVSVLLISRIHK